MPRLSVSLRGSLRLVSFASAATRGRTYGDKIWGKYGLADAFNPQTGWVSTDTLGLDVSMYLLAAENLRIGNLWKWFMANPEPQKAMKLAGIERA
jgi:hypothetical protein